MDIAKIGNLIAELRKKHDWTQNDLAVQLSISDKTVSKWEGGNGLPDITVIPALAKILGITTDELLAGECKKSAPNESVFAKIASGDLDLVQEIENGLNIDRFDEYGKSLADYCAIKNNIDVFRFLFKLKKVHIAHRTETRSNFNMQPGGKETIAYEDVVIYDHAYFTGKYDNPYPRNYSDSALFCLLVKNRADELLQQTKMEVRAFNDAEADCIAEDIDYFYNKYFLNAFPGHIGIITRTLVQKGKTKEAQKLLDLIVSYRKQMEQKRLDCAKETKARGKTYTWSINWDTGEGPHELVYDKESVKAVKMRNKIMAYVWGENERPYIIGNAILFTQDDLVEIGFMDPDFLLCCKKIDICPNIDEAVMLRLLGKDDTKIFDAFTSDVTLDSKLEKLILNTNGKIKAHYTKSRAPKDFNDMLESGDVSLALSLLTKPKEIVLKLKDLKIELLGSKEMLPVLKKFLPFLGHAELDTLLKDIVSQDNTQARIALIEAGAKVLIWKNDEYGYGGSWERDDTQTEILYGLLKGKN